MSQKDERMEKPDWEKITTEIINSVKTHKGDFKRETNFLENDLLIKISSALEEAHEQGKDEQSEIDAGIAEEWEAVIFEPDVLVPNKKSLISEEIRATRKREK